MKLFTKLLRELAYFNKMNRILSFTGHRPSKLNGYDAKDNSKLLWALQSKILWYIEERKVNVFISGMALGIDMWAAKIVLKLKETHPHLKLICAIPCLNHANKWNAKDQEEWKSITEQAEKVIYVTKEDYKPQCMQLRNIWMVDNSDYVLGVWDGTEGGTGNCVKYAQEKEKTIEIINPNDYK